MEYLTGYCTAVSNELQSLRDELACVKANAIAGELVQSLQRELYEMKADFAARVRELEALVQCSTKASSIAPESSIPTNGSSVRSVPTVQIFDIADKDPIGREALEDPWARDPSSDPWKPPPATQLTQKPGPPHYPTKAAPCTKTAPPSGLSSMKAEPKAPPAKGPPAGIPKAADVPDMPSKSAASEEQAQKRPAKAPPAIFAAPQKVPKQPPAGVQVPQAKPLPKGPPAGLSSPPAAAQAEVTRQPPQAKGPPAHLLEHLPPTTAGRAKAPPQTLHEVPRPAGKAPPPTAGNAGRCQVKAAPDALIRPQGTEEPPPAKSPPIQLLGANPAVHHTDALDGLQCS